MIDANEGVWLASVGVNPHRHSAAFRGELADVVTPTVFTVGLMQGSTPRKAGCVRYR